MTTPSFSSAATATINSSDQELVSLSVRGDASAFEFIMRRHNRLMFRTARSILKNDTEAEDVLQEAYVKAWRALHNFRDDAKLSTWLVRIVVNEALGKLRRQRACIIPLDAALIHEADMNTTLSHEQLDDQPAQSILNTQLRGVIESHIDALPDVFRTVFMLRAIEELSVDEVSNMLGIPAATVRTRFFRARSLLRESLAQKIDVVTADAFSFDGARCDRIVSVVIANLAPSQSPHPD